MWWTREEVAEDFSKPGTPSSDILWNYRLDHAEIAGAGRATSARGDSPLLRPGREKKDPTPRLGPHRGTSF